MSNNSTSQNEVAILKRLRVLPIARKDADRIVKAHHYSGMVCKNSQLNLGVFLDGKCGGAMQFGPSLDKRKIQPLVAGTGWNGFLELNRLAFAEWLPKCSESRALGYAMRWIRKTYPHVKWIISFADGTQCGDGAIYRATNFILTGIRPNTQVWVSPDGTHRVMRSTETNPHRNQVTGGCSMKRFADAGYRPLPGFQLRYIYFLDPECRDKLTVPVIPFSKIEELGAGMYRGRKRAEGADSGTADDQSAGGGAIPTSALQPNATDENCDK